MPRCPLCRSALVTITFGLYPIAICTSCSARWIQDGHQQRAINQVETLADGPRPLVDGHQLSQQHPHRAYQVAPGQRRLGGIAMVIHYRPARLRHNSDRPTAITNVLVATSGVVLPHRRHRAWHPDLLGPHPPRPRWALYPNGDQVVVLWPGGELAGSAVEVAREAPTVWAVITMTVSTTRPPRRSGSS